MKSIIKKIGLLVIISCTISSIACCAKVYYYGAYFSAGAGNGRYEVKECSRYDKNADFIMKFNVKKSYAPSKYIKKYKFSINKRLRAWGRYKKEKRNWPFFFAGSYKKLPVIVGCDRHHIISACVIKNNNKSFLNVDNAPAVILPKSVHNYTGSFGGRGKGSEVNSKQSSLLKKKGNEVKAFNVGIEDLKGVLGNFGITNESILDYSMIDSKNYSVFSEGKSSLIEEPKNVDIEKLKDEEIDDFSSSEKEQKGNNMNEEETPDDTAELEELSAIIFADDT